MIDSNEILGKLNILYNRIRDKEVCINRYNILDKYPDNSYLSDAASEKSEQIYTSKEINGFMYQLKYFVLVSEYKSYIMIISNEIYKELNNG